MTELDIVATMPFCALLGGAGIVLLCDLLGIFKGIRLPLTLLAVIGGWVSMLPQAMFAGQGIHPVAFDGLISMDLYGVFFSGIISLGTVAGLLLCHNQMVSQRAHSSVDVDLLMLFAAAGAIVMVVAQNLMVLFLGFELMSVCVYALTGIARSERASSEGALKYFILGAFSSAFLLYGMVLVYGATGSMQIMEISRSLSFANPMLLLGVGLMVFGFGFKVAAAPFHFWVSDVYQGAPVSVAAFMAVVVKAAAFGAFMRVFASGLAGINVEWQGLIWIICALSMTVGNLVALWQRSVKRMLAYSSIAHAGYALMGFLVPGELGGTAATIFYILGYSVITLAAFGIVLLVTAGTSAQYDKDSSETFAGIGWTRPWFGLAMTLALLSLAGMPPLVGFIGKFYLFSAVINGGFTGLAIIAALNSVVSLYYYLGLIVVMYFRSDSKEAGASDSLGPANQQARRPVVLTWGPRVVVFGATAASVYLGLCSGWWYELARQAAANL